MISAGSIGMPLHFGKVPGFLSERMGNMGDIMKMMGVGGMLGISSEDQNKIATEGEALMSRYEIAINSMTIAERRQPELIDFSRRRRIARGAGLKENEIGKMLNEFEKMREVMKYMKGIMGGGLFGGGIPGMGGGPDLNRLKALGGGKTPEPSADELKAIQDRLAGLGNPLGGGGQLPGGLPGLPGFPPKK